MLGVQWVDCEHLASSRAGWLLAPVILSKMKDGRSLDAVFASLLLLVRGYRCGWKLVSTSATGTRVDCPQLPMPTLQKYIAGVGGKQIRSQTSDFDAPQATQPPSHPQGSPLPRIGGGPPKLSLEQAVQMQDALIAGYSSPEFQAPVPENGWMPFVAGFLSDILRFCFFFPFLFFLLLFFSFRGWDPQESFLVEVESMLSHVGA